MLVTLTLDIPDGVHEERGDITASLGVVLFADGSSYAGWDGVLSTRATILDHVAHSVMSQVEADEAVRDLIKGVGNDPLSTQEKG